MEKIKKPIQRVDESTTDYIERWRQLLYDNNIKDHASWNEFTIFEIMNKSKIQEEYKQSHKIRYFFEKISNIFPMIIAYIVIGVFAFAFIKVNFFTTKEPHIFDCEMYGVDWNNGEKA